MVFTVYIKSKRVPWNHSIANIMTLLGQGISSFFNFNHIDRIYMFVTHLLGKVGVVGESSGIQQSEGKSSSIVQRFVTKQLKCM